MNRMNWKIIESNIREAREQLEEIERLISSKKYPCEEELQVMVEHAYHHLNFAWNTRRVTTKEYRKLTDEEFNRWGKGVNGVRLALLEFSVTISAWHVNQESTTPPRCTM